MPAPKAIDAYPKQIEAMQMALEAPNGVKLRFSDKQGATSFRRMCYKARSAWASQTQDSSFAELSITLTESIKTGEESEWTLIISKPPKIDMEAF